MIPPLATLRSHSVWFCGTEVEGGGNFCVSFQLIPVLSLTYQWCISISMAQISPFSIINQPHASPAGAFIPQFCTGSFLFLMRKILLRSRQGISGQHQWVRIISFPIFWLLFKEQCCSTGSAKEGRECLAWAGGYFIAQCRLGYFVSIIYVLQPIQWIRKALCLKVK